jgi:hypothetical protein
MGKCEPTELQAGKAKALAEEAPTSIYEILDFIHLCLLSLSSS